uniref:Ig-like domain-containing protein n=1 Tax=Amphilophus citrinellus TaxID=61819 RepID=A0A3Q0S754_AMPCI
TQIWIWFILHKLDQNTIQLSKSLQQDVQVKLGENVTLQCQISTEETISMLKWSRADLNTDGYVYFYRNRRSYENYQHPSFHGRVKLRNPEMKDGDVSLILENVTFNDTGIYECHIAVRNSGRNTRAHTEISHFMNLTVTGECAPPENRLLSNSGRFFCLCDLKQTECLHMFSLPVVASLVVVRRSSRMLSQVSLSQVISAPPPVRGLFLRSFVLLATCK